MKEKRASYIKKIVIDNLWDRVKISWSLRPDVNILSGINGVGKTTILNHAIDFLENYTGEVKSSEELGVKIEFDDPEATSIPYSIIRSYDRPLLVGDTAKQLVNQHIKSELDWQLYLLQRDYLDYQVNKGNQMIALLSSGESDKLSRAQDISLRKKQFQDFLDELFGYTGKKIDRSSNEIAFLQGEDKLYPYMLSSGEKQMLIILLTVLVQDNKHCVLFMDEPEASLHIDWQQRLIGMILELNPNVQLILTTHSPAVIMEGWLDAVTEVSDISTPLEL